MRGRDIQKGDIVVGYYGCIGDEPSPSDSDLHMNLEHEVPWLIISVDLIREEGHTFTDLHAISADGVPFHNTGWLASRFWEVERCDS